MSQDATALRSQGAAVERAQPWTKPAALKRYILTEARSHCRTQP